MIRSHVSEFPVITHALGTLRKGEFYFLADETIEPEGVQIHCVGSEILGGHDRKTLVVKVRAYYQQTQNRLIESGTKVRLKLTERTSVTCEVISVTETGSCRVLLPQGVVIEGYSSPLGSRTDGRHCLDVHAIQVERI